MFDGGPRHASKVADHRDDVFDTAAVCEPRGDDAACQGSVVGTWTLVSIRYVRPDGSTIEPFGSNAKGILVFDGRRFATQAMAANLPKFASNNRMVGTPEEYEAISHGVLAYFGTYTVNEADRMVTLHIERSSFPNWEGTDQQRKFEFVGDELRYTAASSTANPAEAAQLVWKKAQRRQ